MPDPRNTPVRTEAARTDAARETPSSESEPKQRSAAQVDADRNLGVTTGGTSRAMQEELAALGVNPRLDNRIGDQRPVLAGKVKPQQIDGPEVGHFAAHAERFAEEAKNVLLRNAVDGEIVGAKSEGPHGRGPHGVTVGDEHGQPVAPEGSAGDKKDPRNPA